MSFPYTYHVSGDLAHLKTEIKVKDPAGKSVIKTGLEIDKDNPNKVHSNEAGGIILRRFEARFPGSVKPWAQWEAEQAEAVETVKPEKKKK